jgi:hypothetical protein
MPTINQITNFKIGGVTYTGTSAQLNFNSGVIAGVALPSKTLVLDASGTISGINSLNVTTVNATNMIITNLLLNGTPLTADSLGLISGVVPGTLLASKALSVDSFGKLNSTFNVGNSIVSGDFGSNSNGTNGTNGLFRFISSAGTCFIQSGITLTADSSADLFFGNLQSSIGSSSRKIIFKANGNVGINTSAPLYTLDVIGTARVQNLLLGTSTDNTKIISALDNTISNGVRRSIMLGKNLNNFNNVEFFWNNTSDGSSANYAGFAITGFGDLLTIMASSKIGVNTTVPIKQFDINSSTGDCLRLIRNNNSGTSTNYSDFSIDNTGRLTINPSGGNVNIPTHNGSTTGLELGGVLLTASAADLNTLGGFTPGVVTANKLLVVDNNRDLSAIRNLDVNGIFTNFNVGNLLVISYGSTELAGRPIKYDLINDFSSLTSYNPVDTLDGNVVYSTNYSMEIIGYIKPLYTENYTFFITGDDRVRLWVNDVMIFQNWSTLFSETTSSVISLNANSWYPIRIHYQQLTAASSLSIKWQSTSQSKANISATRMAWDMRQALTLQNPSFTNSLSIFNSSSSLSVLYNSLLSSTGTMTYNISGGASPMHNFANGNVNIASHTSGANGLQLSGVAVNSIASELNYNAGVTLGNITSSKVLTVDSNSRINNELKINSTAVIGDFTGSNGIVKINNSGGVILLTCGTNTSAGSSADLFIGNYDQSIASSSRKFIIKSSGNVGIGTESPTYPLSVLTSGSSFGLSHSNGSVIFNTFVGGSITGAYLQTFSNHPLALSTNNAAAQVILSTNGSFNIVNHNGTTTGLQLSGTLVTSTAIEINRLAGITPGTALSSKAIILDSSSNITGINNLIATNLTGTLQTNAQPSITSVGTLTSLITSGAISSTNTITTSRAGIGFIHSDGVITLSSNVNNTSTSTALFGTTSSHDLSFITSGSNRIRITAAGNVGMGTTSPAFQLDVSGTTRSTNAIFGITTFSTATSSPFIIQSTTAANASLITNNTVSLATIINTSTANIFTLSNHNLVFGANGSNEYLTISTSGNIGINTNSPTHSLHVNGVIRSDAQLLIGATSIPSVNYLIEAKYAAQADGSKVYFSLGKSATTSNRLDLHYHHITNGSTSNYAGFGFGGSTNLFNVYANGSVAIGLLSNTYTFEVAGTSRISQLLIGTSTDNASGVLLSMLDSTIANATSKKQFSFGKANTISNSLACTWFHTSDGSTANYVSFDILNNTSTLTIAGTGNVGIGTSTPAVKFDVTGLARSTTFIAGNATTLPGNAGIGIVDSNITSAANRNIIIGKAVSSYNIAEIGFRLVSDGSISNYGVLGMHTTGSVLVWTAAGNVGIGTLSPTVKLEVSGTIKATSSMFGDTSNTNLPVEVGSISTAFNTAYAYLNSNAQTGTSPNSNGSFNYSLRCTGRIICGGEINITSDKRKKKNIINLSDEFCLNFIKKSEPVSYLYNDTTETKTHYGFIAQDLIKQGFEQLVSLAPETGMIEEIEEDGFVNPKDIKFVLCYDEIIPILTKNIQMMYKNMLIMQDKINNLEARLTVSTES